MSINSTKPYSLDIKTQYYKFGSVTSRTRQQSNSYSLNSSIFLNYKQASKASTNPFYKMSKNDQSNAIAQLNKMQAEQKSSSTTTGFVKSLKDTFNAGKDVFKAYDKLFGSSSKKAEGTSGSNKSSQTVNDIKNADEKTTLNQALDSASNEQKTLQSDEKKVNQEAKTVENKSTQAKQQAQQTEQSLNSSTQQLNQDEQSLEQAKAEVQTCTDNYSSAQTNTANCKQALESAKSAATEDNPNTAAIAEAESNLKAAEAQEEQAKQALESAQQKETQAQQAVDNSTQQVKLNETQNNEAQQAADTAENETASVKTEQQSIQSQNQELQTSITEGEQRLQQMEGSTETVNTEDMSADEYAQSGGNIEGDPSYQSLQQNELDGTEFTEQTINTNTKVNNNTTENTTNTENKSDTANLPSLPASDDPAINMQIDEINYVMNSGNLTEEQRNKVIEDYNKINNMQPGETVVINGKKFTMDSEGNVNGYNKADQANMAASTTARRARAANNT